MNIFTRKAEQSIDLTEPIELRLLRHRLRRIEEVLAELPLVEATGSRDSRGNPRFTPKEAAQVGARRDLQDLRRTTLAAIADLTATPDLDKATRDERLLDLDEQEKREHLPGQLARWVKEDLAQWRLKFVHQVVLREVAAKQFGLIRYTPPGY